MERQTIALRLTRRYAASPAEVWAALTEPDSLARWLARPARLDLVPGGAFELDFPSSPSKRLAGSVRAVEPERVLEIDWRYPGEEPSVVRFELSPDDDGTVLVLDHRQLEERLGQGYATGWTHHLQRLERRLDAGGAE